MDINIIIYEDDLMKMPEKLFWEIWGVMGMIMNKRRERWQDKQREVIRRSAGFADLWFNGTPYLPMGILKEG